MSAERTRRDGGDRRSTPDADEPRTEANARGVPPGERADPSADPGASARALGRSTLPGGGRLTRAHAIEIGSLACVGVGFAVAVGPLGLVLGALVLGCRLLGPPEAAFGVGCVVLAAVTDPSQSVGTLVVAAGLWGLLVPELWAVSRRAVAGATAAFVGLAASAVAVASGGEVLGAALALVVGSAVGLYVLHRYQRVVLGLAGGADA